MTTKTDSANRTIVFLTAQVLFTFALAFVFLPSAWAGLDEDLSKAAAAGDVSAVRAALAHGSDVNRRDTLGETPLSEAAMNGHAKVAKVLLAHGADPDRADMAGVTPLSWAASQGYAEVVKLLLAHGADVNRAGTDVPTPLLWAADHGHTEVVKLLLAHGADVNSADKFGNTPLYWGTIEGHAEVVKVLLAAGATPTQVILNNAEGEIKTLIREALNAAPPSSFSPPVVGQTDSPRAPSAPSEEDIQRIVKQAVASALAKNTTSAPSGPSAEEIRQIVQQAVQSSKAKTSSSESQDQRIAKAVAMALKTANEKKTVVPLYRSPVDRPSFRSREKRHMYALVIGVEHYPGGLPDAQFADRDAQAVYRYLIALGVPSDHIRRLTDGTATRGRIRMDLRWLKRNAKPDSTVWVYFSGHGAPGARGHAYLVPSGGDPNGLAYTAFREDRLYRDLDRLPAKRVLVALDACFSGSGGRSVLGKGMRPLTLVRKETFPSTGKLIVFSASRADQEAGPKESAGHGLFTYYFLKGLDGGAEQGGHVTVGSLSRYLKAKVPEAASLDNHDQVPQVEPHPVGEIAKVEIR